MTHLLRGGDRRDLVRGEIFGGEDGAAAVRRPAAVEESVGTESAGTRRPARWRSWTDGKGLGARGPAPARRLAGDLGRTARMLLLLRR